MDLLLLAAKALVAIAFALAGALKLVDGDGFKTAIRDFGVPALVAPATAAVLPPIEIGVALMMLFGPTARWGAAGAVVLLGVFTAAIGANIARGRTPACRCFGQLQSTPIGWPTLARNGLLLALSVLVVVSGPGLEWGAAYQRLTALTSRPDVQLIAIAAGTVALGAQSWLVMHALRQNGRLLIRLDALEGRPNGLAPAPPRSPDGLAIGAPAPTFDFRTLTGRVVNHSTLRTDAKPSLFVFTSPDCGPCTEMLPGVVQWQRVHHDMLNVVLVTSASKEIKHRIVDGRDTGEFLVQADDRVAEAFRVHGTPAAVLLTPDGRIGSHVAMGAKAIADVVARATLKSASQSDPLSQRSESTKRSTVVA